MMPHSNPRVVRLVGAVLLLLFIGVAGRALAPPCALAQNQSQSKPARQESTRDAALRRQIAVWQKFFDQAAKLLTEPSTTVAQLEARREKLRDVASEIRKLVEEQRRRHDEVASLLKALGPTPKSGEASEATARRETLEEDLAAKKRRLTLVELAEKESTNLLARLDTQRNTLIARQLTRKGPSLWNRKTWVGAFEDAKQVFGREQRAAIVWQRDLRRELADSPARYGLTALSIIVLAWLALMLRGWVIEKWGRRHETAPTGVRQIIIATLAVAIAGGLMPAALLFGLYVYLRSQGLAVGDFGYIIRAAALSIGLVIVFWAMSRAVFAPIVVSWRPMTLSDRKARTLDFLVRSLGVVLAAVWFADVAATNRFVSQELQAVWSLFAVVPVAVLMLLIAQRELWVVETEATSADVIADKSLPRLRGARLIMTVGALVGLAALPFDMYRLSEFALTGTLATVAILLVARLLRRFAMDAVGLILRDEDGQEAGRLLQFWFSLLVDIVIALVALTLMLVVWSVDIDSLGRLATEVWSGAKVGKYTISLGDILFGLAIFFVLVMLVRSAQRTFDERVRTGTRLDPGVRNALRTGLGYLGIVIAAAVAITVAGFDLSNLAIIAGALSVGIGFGLQAIVNNFVSGLILLMERSIKEGDWIVAGGEEGVVRKIGIRATEIRTFRNASVIIPNAKLISDPVTNWVFQDRTGRGELIVGVAYGSDTELVRRILLGCAHEHPLVRKNPAPNVLFKDFGDSALIFDLRFYLNDMYDVVAVPSDLRFEIDKRFRAGGIEIPFPQRDMHIKTPGGAVVSGAAKKAKSDEA